MKLLSILLVQLYACAPLVSSTVSVSTSSASPSATPVPKTQDQVINVNTKNDVTNAAIDGNAANRDQTNNVVSQANTAKGPQQVIGSQSDRHDVNVANTKNDIVNNSNTTVTNVDQSVHNTTNTAISNDFSDKSQKTVKNSTQQVQNVYNIQKIVEGAPVPAPGSSAPQAQLSTPESRVQAPVQAPVDAKASQGTAYVQTITGRRVSMDMVRKMIENAKKTSDMAYDMALQLTQ